MSSNISNGFINKGTGFLPHNNLPYSPQFDEALKRLKSNPPQAALYLKEREKGIHTLLFFIGKHPKTSTFHNDPRLNELFDKDPNDGGLTEKDIAHLEKIFPRDIITSELESKDELQLFPHDNNESNLLLFPYNNNKDINNSSIEIKDDEHVGSYTQRRSQNMPNTSAREKNIINAYSHQLTSMTQNLDYDGIRRTLQEMMEAGISIHYSTIYYMVDYMNRIRGISNNILKYQEFIEIMIEYFSHPNNITVLYKCKTISNAELKKITTETQKRCHCIYMTYDSENKQVGYWQKKRRDCRQLILNPGMTLPQGEYPQTQLSAIFSNFEPFQTPLSMSFELLFKEVNTVNNLETLIHLIRVNRHPFSTAAFQTAFIACNRVAKQSYSLEDKHKVSELSKLLFDIIEHPSGHMYYMGILIMAQVENHPAIEGLLLQGIHDNMFNPTLGFDSNKRILNTSFEQRRNLITSRFSIKLDDFTTFIYCIYPSLLNIHIRKGNIKENTQISMVYNKEGENLTVKALNGDYGFRKENAGRILVITSVKRHRINNF